MNHNQLMNYSHRIFKPVSAVCSLMYFAFVAILIYKYEYRKKSLYIDQNFSGIIASEERSRMWVDIWENAIFSIFIPLGFLWFFIFFTSLIAKYFVRKS